MNTNDTNDATTVLTATDRAMDRIRIEANDDDTFDVYAYKPNNGGAVSLCTNVTERYAERIADIAKTAIFFVTEDDADDSAALVADNDALATNDDMVAAIRNDARVGRNTCSTIDECLDDNEVVLDVIAMGEDGKTCTTINEALRSAYLFEGLQLEQELNAVSDTEQHERAADVLQRMNDLDTCGSCGNDRADECPARGDDGPCN